MVSIAASNTLKGEKWNFTVRPSDGTDSGTTILSASVTIRNGLPVASTLSLTPANPLTSSLLNATYSYADGDVHIR